MKQELHPIDAAKHLGETLAENIDHVRREAADSLEDAASTVRSSAAHGIDAIDHLAEGAAGRLDSTAKYVREHDPLCAVRNTIRRNPGITLLCGIAAGFFVGYSTRRN